MGRDHPPYPTGAAMAAAGASTQHGTYNSLDSGPHGDPFSAQSNPHRALSLEEEEEALR